jgi:hypothetical protein
MVMARRIPMFGLSRLHNRRKPMSKLKTLSAVLIVSAAIATPVFAQDAGPVEPGSHHGQRYGRSHYRAAYNQAPGSSDAAPLTNEEKRNLEDFGWTGRDPSRVGGMFPYFNGGTGN